MLGKLYTVGSLTVFFCVSFIKFQVKSHHIHFSTINPQCPRVSLQKHLEEENLKLTVGPGAQAAQSGGTTHSSLYDTGQPHRRPMLDWVAPLL